MEENDILFVSYCRNNLYILKILKLVSSQEVFIEYDLNFVLMVIENIIMV